MIFYMLLGFLVLAAVIWFTTWYANTTQKSAARAAKIVLGVGAGLFALFMLTRGGAPAIVSGLIVLAPMLLGLRGAFRRARATQGPSPGGESKVSSAWFEMTLDHDDGGISGRVLLGAHAGRELDDLTESELDDLLDACRDDENSRRLLEAYLAKRFGYAEANDGDPADDASGGGGSGGASARGSNMGVEEACNVLSVTADADAAEITRAHKRLIALAHPDRGGSAYLAAKINEARDVLLRHK